MSLAAQSPSVGNPAASAPLSAAVLLARGLTPGKLRGLNRISQPDGTICILALDQNASMITMAREALARQGHDREPTYEEIVDAKLDLARQIAPAASGVLIDGYYGAWPAVASGAVPPDRGMLVRLERSGAPKTPAGVPLTLVEAGWSVEKIKLMGADALKLLAPFDPTEPESAERQLATVQEVAEQCRRFDLLFLLEPISVPIRGETKTDPRYLDRKPSTVIESARLLSRYADVYKSEFPGTLDRETDEQLCDNLQALGAATERPWVLLSAGVDYDQYRRQVEMALEAGGASGTLGGRAYWKEYFHQDTPAARTAFAATTGRERVAEIAAMVREQGTPWFERYGFTAEDFAAIRPAEGWNARYAPHAAAAGGDGAVVIRKGDVY